MGQAGGVHRVWGSHTEGQLGGCTCCPILLVILGQAQYRRQFAQLCTMVWSGVRRGGEKAGLDGPAPVLHFCFVCLNIARSIRVVFPYEDKEEVETEPRKIRLEDV